MFGALIDNYRYGIPLSIGHDVLRPIGWSHPLSVHLEPGLTRLFGLDVLIENDEESEKLNRSMNAHLYHLFYECHKSDILQIKKLLNPYLDGSEKVFVKECVALCSRGLAKRLAPKLFSHANDDGLIPLSLLDPIIPGVYRFGEFAIFAHQYFRRSFTRLNSLNTPFLNQFYTISKEAEYAGIALDEDMVGLISTCITPIEHAYWWGPTFSGDLSSITPDVTVHAQNESSITSLVIRTEFQWKQTDEYYVFCAEELPDLTRFPISEPSIPCRYVHSLIEPVEAHICHFDGATRTYDINEYKKRLTVDISKSGRKTIYQKLWRLDGAFEVPIWKRLLSDYFRDNELIGEYLGASPEPETQQFQEENRRLHDSERIVVPYSVARGSGVRLSLAITPHPSELSEDISIVANDWFAYRNEHIYYVEMQVIELIKLLRKDGIVITLPKDTKLMQFKDNYVNFPNIIFPSINNDSHIQSLYSALTTLLGCWKQKNYDVGISFSYSVLLGDALVSYSCLGHLDDLVAWLHEDLSRPPLDLAKLSEWGQSVANYLKHKYPPAQNIPALSVTLMESGLLRYVRDSIDVAESNILSDKSENSLIFALKVFETDSPAKDLLVNQEVGPALSYIVKHATCSKCMGNYIDCEHSHVFDKEVDIIIDECAPVGFFWSDRPSWNYSISNDTEIPELYSIHIVAPINNKRGNI